MGSISSRPAVPSTTIVHQTAPTSTTDSGSSATEPEQSTAELASDNRESSLLKRDRGRGGTVQTSFRGLVEEINGGTSRKTLLGE